MMHKTPGAGLEPAAYPPRGLAIAPRGLNTTSNEGPAGDEGKRNEDGDIPRLCRIFDGPIEFRESGGPSLERR